MKRLLFLGLLVLSVTAAAYRIMHADNSHDRYPLTAYVPQDALLTISSPDFSALLQQWEQSSESKAWLASMNYAAFQNSRLVGRLSDAETSYEKASGVGAGELLHQVAGKESVFAWYDIGALQFLYISRLSAAQAQKVELLQSHDGFERRHAGNNDFYIKTSGASYSTVAFARVSTPSGDLLLLATREDLIANALKLIAGNADTPTVAEEPWHKDASAAIAQEDASPALHMVLNLDRIAADPHFVNYWIQRNITWTSQFRAAASDLYLEADRFREERVLVPKPSAAPMDSAPNLAAFTESVPASTGVFRAFATHDPADAKKAIQEKLLGANTASTGPSIDAPDANLAMPATGTDSDLEVHIDAAPTVSASASWDALQQLLRQGDLDAVMTASSASVPSADSLWVPIHSAVVLRGAKSWNGAALAPALQSALRGSLTTSNIGIDFRQESAHGVDVFSLDGPRPLVFAVTSSPTQGSIIVLADTRPLLDAILNGLAKATGTSDAATVVAGFNHQTQAAPFHRLASLIDGPPVPQRQPNDVTTVDAAPMFFSGSIGSLSDAFQGMQSQHVEERYRDGVLRQTVLYHWAPR